MPSTGRICLIFFVTSCVGWAGEERVLFSDDFLGPPREWGSAAGEWAAAAGVFHGREAGSDRNAMAFPADCPEIDNGAIEARVRMGERLAKGGWALAGIALFRGPGDFWMIALNEDAQRARCVDFIECRGGRWQAQREGMTRLKEVLLEGGAGSWRRDEAHILRFDLDEKGISGVVLTSAGETVARRRFEFGDADAVRSGRPALLVRGCAADFDDVRVTSSYPGGVRRVEMPIARGPSGAAAVLREDLPGADARVADAVAAALRDAGFGVNFLSADQACDRAALHASNFDLYAVPCAASYPRAGFEALASYMGHGGDILLVGGPAFTHPAVRIENAWMDRAGYATRLSSLKAERILLDGKTGVAGWSLSAKNPKCGATLLPDTGDESPCLKFEVPDLDGWAMFQSRPAPPVFPPGHDSVCLRTRGAVEGVPVTIELIEADGSRWMATVELSSRWMRHVIPTSEFSYWKDSATEHRRGRPGDRCHPEAVVRVQIGLANAIAQVAPGRHVFWLDDFGTTKNTIGVFDGPGSPEAPVIETASPSYKTSPLTDIRALRVSAGGALSGCEALPSPASGTMFSHIRRPGAAGFGSGRPWRVLPLVDALDASGRRRGAVAWLTIHAEPPLRGCAVGCVGINDSATLASATGRALIAAVARRMSDGLFLVEAGANRFTCRPGEALDLGAKIVNCGAGEAAATVRVELIEGDRSVWAETAGLHAIARATDTARFPWRAGGDARTLTARVIVSRGDRILDTAAHELVCEAPPALAPEDFIVVRNGEFYWRGKPWHPVGVNYWPLYAAGLETADYGGGWLQPKFYDPALIEEDLALMRHLGMNLVSIQLGAPEEIPCLRDFLRRCGARGIWVNGFLRGASPVAFDEAAVRELIGGAGLRDNPVLFAYDTIWEAGNHLFKWPARKNWDSDWRRWIVERYESIENAEKDWACAVPREGDRVTAPSDKQMQSDGPWRIMVAAYRRFMDDITSRGWNDATRRLKAIDPNHLISFRQGNTLFYDFALTGPVKHIDFISPEGYAIPDTEEGRDAAGFITRYVKFTTGGKPVYWSEFGRSVWDRKRMAVDAAMIPVQAGYHETFHRMAVETGASGLAPWWWPGGYRVNEQSDYGIINPDGTPRPSAELFLKYGPLLWAAAPGRRPVQWMTMDRDAHPGGYWHVTFNAGREASRKAREAGCLLAIRTEATGRDSSNVPLIAVGNSPCNGSNPPKYLNAEFNRVLIRNGEGQWIEIGPDSVPEIRVNPGAPVLARVSAGNLGEALWLAPSKHPGLGGVYLASRESDPPIKVPIQGDVPHLSDAEFGEFKLCDAPARPARIVLQMTALERAWFGEKREVRLVPQ